MSCVLQAARLHSEAFHEPPEALPFLAPITSFTYSLQSFSLQLLTYFMQGSNHITVMASRPGQATGSSSSSSTSDVLLQQQCVGTANVSLRLADTGFCEAIDCKPGTPFIIVTNMAVSEPYRGKGIGRQLMTAAIDQALAQFKPSAELLVLMVYLDNKTALGLYRSFGFIDTRWVDPRWLSDAERSRVGQPRRLLLVKKLQQGKP
jgi:ribosomal protein S18 acetylase RimI-like enzyme